MSPPTALEQLADRAVRFAHRLPDAATLASWNPPLSGDIPIRIRRDAVWEHDGRPIHREALWKLFAALLRREQDGCYYLLTPLEKWRIQVESHALLVVDVEPGDRARVCRARLNSDATQTIDAEYRLHVPPDAPEPWLSLPNGLTARLTRAAWYRLVASASRRGQELIVLSAGLPISLGYCGEA